MTRIIEQVEGHPPIRRWSDGHGGEWACIAPDHGPMCRLCEPVDEVLAALLGHVEEGAAVAKANAEGKMEFRCTQLGLVKVEESISTDPEMALLWARLTTGGAYGEGRARG